MLKTLLKAILPPVISAVAEWLTTLVMSSKRGVKTPVNSNHTILETMKTNDPKKTGQAM